MDFKILILLIRMQFHLDMSRFTFWLSDLATSFVPKDTVRRSLFLDNPINRKLTRIGLSISNWFLMRAKDHNDKTKLLNSMAKEMIKRRKLANEERKSN